MNYNPRLAEHPASALEIAERLGGRRVGPGWMARCPAHEDRSPSLSIAERSGKVVVHCHAGCQQADVIAALRESGIWPEREQRREQRIVEAVYTYSDEGGHAVYEVLRYRPKAFAQRYSDGAGGWIWRKHPRQLIFHLREVIESPIVFVAEGEKDCEALRHYGFTATCNSGGAGKWSQEFNRFFAGKEVCILPDADPPGWRHALDVAGGLAGIAAKVEILELPGAKDASEWFEAGHSELEFIELFEAPCSR